MWLPRIGLMVGSEGGWISANKDLTDDDIGVGNTHHPRGTSCCAAPRCPVALGFSLWITRHRESPFSGRALYLGSGPMEAREAWL